jgi:diacylglycerol kinase (ATP)
MAVSRSAPRIQRVLLAVNPHARSGRDAAARAEECLRSAGHTVTTLPFSGNAQLSAGIGAARADFDIVAVGGGDGTLVHAVDGLRACGLPLAIIPLGTTNELARTLGIPFDITQACALVSDGVERPIDAGCVNGAWFFNEASIGLSTHVVREQTGEVKRRWGMLSIPIATLRAWRHLRPYHLEVESEAGRRTFRTVQLTVANSYRFGGVVENPDAAIDDGMLDLYSIDLEHWWDAFAVIGAVARRAFPQAHNVTAMRAASFVVRSRRPHHVFTDGEPATQTPAEFRVVPAAVRVLVPR